MRKPETRPHDRFLVEESLSYNKLPPAPELTPAAGFGRELREVAARLPESTGKRAVWVVHGMGQQVPYETLEQVAEGLIGASERANPGQKLPIIRFREVKVGTTILQRLELSIPDAPGSGREREIHLYEYYWAPKTEGAVKLKDVISFLWDAGTRGLMNYWTGFGRALFGQMVDFPLSWRTPTFLLLALAVLASIMVINAIVIGTGASLAGISAGTSFIAPDRVPPLTSIAGIVCAVAISFGVTLFLAEMARPAKTISESYGRALRNLSWLGLGITVFTILAGASLMALNVWIRWMPARFQSQDVQRALATFTNVAVLMEIAVLGLGRAVRWRSISEQKKGSIAPDKLHSAPNAEPKSRNAVLLPVLFYTAFLIHVFSLLGVLWLAAGGGQYSPWLAHTFDVLSSPIWIWPFLFLITAVVRRLLIQYVGDVTAYISSNKIDKFEELRKKIKDLAKESAGAVFQAKAENDIPEYEKIAILGHSLGSVIAYDTLNRLIADDILAQSMVGVTRRTCLFLTFGSPLDKIAFFFSVMGKNTRRIREQLASVAQPLIRDYGNRTFPWVNVFSRNDIICGPLEFYDLPGKNVPPGVENVRDPHAMIPLVAHVVYWENQTVWNILLKEIAR